MNKRLKELYLESLADSPEAPGELSSVRRELQEDFDMYVAVLCEYVWTCGYNYGQKRMKHLCRRK